MALPKVIIQLYPMFPSDGEDGRKANRKEMFDLGLSGPLAGLIIALPVFWIGIEQGADHG